ncbi:hypothetical protein BpHYR1_005317 [Brachionus plicatilis]|uniref:Uncharacterized protein n=1 Tax=Brachionus plicatilis TaxID=10195 RepID=A0A3M7QBJ5_BRAPC|nr:hypothetical protein BpHYR1_005317 [Brachionus plicatilis]
MNHFQYKLRTRKKINYTAGKRKRVPGTPNDSLKDFDHDLGVFARNFWCAEKFFACAGLVDPFFYWKYINHNIIPYLEIKLDLNYLQNKKAAQLQLIIVIFCQITEINENYREVKSCPENKNFFCYFRLEESSLVSSNKKN